MKVDLESVGNLIQGLSSLFQAAKHIKSGMEGIQVGLGRVPRQIEGTDPKVKVLSVKENIDHRAKLIIKQIRKGQLNGIVRANASAIVSAKCSTCPNCRAKNYFSTLKDYVPKKMVKGTVYHSVWVCGKCKSENPITATSWCNPEKNYFSEVEAIFDYIRANVRYTRDFNGVDLYQSAARTLEFASGDCDDYTITLGSLLGAVGYPVAIHIMETKNPATGQRVGSWNHIMLLVGLPPRAPSKWVALDASLNVKAGWYPHKDMIYKTKTYKV